MSIGTHLCKFTHTTDLLVAIERCDITPAILSSLLEVGDDDWLEQSVLQHLLVGGEKLVPSTILEVHRRKPSLMISAVYGPTEATVTTVSYTMTPSFYENPPRQVPIGYPHPNTTVFVVDRSLQPVPLGVVGEIVLAGPQLCRGYVGQPELTAARYVHTSSESPLGVHRIYLTGDLGYWTADGLLHFVARMDSQVKVRGQRIETEEVEHVLELSPYVKSSVVVAVKDDNRDLLVGYVNLNTESEDDLLALWREEYNQESLCEDMVNAEDEYDSAKWQSMMDGTFIPQFEMDQWLFDTIEQIAARLEDRVLEIGVGTGQIALRLKNRVKSFIGTDLSRPALDYLQQQIDKQGLSSRFSLRHGAAHELYDLFSSSKSTLAIINSVAQYFPSARYLTTIITQLIKSMDSGRIFIGDVRSYNLIQYHDTERAIGSLPRHASVMDVRKALDGFTATQTELLINPSFFYGLKRRIPEITHVEILPKTMPARNELSRYRYAVIIHIGVQPSVLTPSSWVDLSTVKTPHIAVRQILRDSSQEIVGVTRVPIADLEHIRSIHSLISEVETKDVVADLRVKLQQPVENFAASPAALAHIGAEEGWTAFFDYSVQGFTTENYIQVVFVRASILRLLDHDKRLVGGFEIPAVLSGPLHNKITGASTDVAQIKELISNHLRESLPKYMIPHLIHLKPSELPLTNAGKLDRKRLASAEFLDAHDKGDVVDEEIEPP